MAEVMRACQLRAGLSRAGHGREFVLGNPKSWLGTAYHEVLERIAAAPLAATLDSLVEQLWNNAVQTLHQRAMAHRLDQRFGEATTWPGYHLARAAVQLRAGELMAEAMQTRAIAPAAVQGPPSTLQEQEFTAFEGRLLGRPDVVRGDDVIDYKSGAILEFDEITQSEVVKAAYIRQLRIYGFLVHAKLGRWPKRGVLLPLAGGGVEVPLDPVSCEREARDTITLLDAYNAKIKAQLKPEQLANPSDAACKWCPFKLICPSFWKAVSPAWSGQLDSAAIEGTLDGPVRSIHGGAAFAASIEVIASSETLPRAEIAPLNPSVHLMSPAITAGDRVRLVGLRVRPDGKLVPTMRTTLVRVGDLPAMETGEDAAP